jgi:hypothetical protein
MRESVMRERERERNEGAERESVMRRRESRRLSVMLVVASQLSLLIESKEKKS